MPIRLFTAGTHTTKGGTFSFSNDDIDRIFSDTLKTGVDPIPFVLGHPEDNLPIIGWLPKKAIKRYTEGSSVSLGFERGDEVISKESLDAIRDLKSNKISVSVREGVIRHIGLVGKAAVEANNTQNFSAGTLTGEFSAGDEITDHQPTDFQKFINDFKNEVKTIFKSNTNMTEEKKPEAANADFAALVGQNKKLAEQVAALTGLVTGVVSKQKATADFSAPEYKDLTQAQKDSAAAIMADLGTEESKTALKGLLKELAKPKAVVENGSKAKEFGAPEKETRTAEEIVRDQLQNLSV
jgi:hypothetical protein